MKIWRTITWTLLVIFGLAALGLIYKLLPGLWAGEDPAGTVQAIAAALTILPTMVLLVFAVNSEARASTSEAENQRLRETAEKQAAAMQALAAATVDQTNLLRGEHAENSAVRLHLIDIGQEITIAGQNGGPRRVPFFQILNMSAHALYIKSATFLTTPGTIEHPVDFVMNNAGMLGRSFLLHPGGSAQAQLPYVSRLAPYAGGGSPSVRGYRISVECVYPGQASIQKYFKVEWADWSDYSKVTITPIAENGDPVSS